MLSSKSKSGVSEASLHKGTPATPRAGKLARTASTKADPASPQQSARLSIDRSTKPIDSKPVIEQRTTKVISAQKQLRVTNEYEMQQTQLSAVQEELEKAKERQACVEKEKSQILEEIKSAKRSADEANGKIQDALVARRIAEEASEIDKFRAVELEQAAIEAAQHREEEWQKEVEIVRNQHATDVAALLATTQELHRVQHELAIAIGSKNSALSHADDAMKIAEIGAHKVELLSREVSRLKVLLDSTLESKEDELSELTKKQLHLQSKLDLVQENLKKADDRLLSYETEKTYILEELNEAKRLTDEASEKLGDNLAARMRAEKALETIKNRTSELEQEIIKSARKREEEWQKKFDSVEHQRAMKAATLLSTVEELEMAKCGLQVATDARNTALNQARDAVKNAETSEQKLQLLLQEVGHLEAALGSKMEMESQVSILRNELEEAKAAEKRLLQMETLMLELVIEISDAKKAESDASQKMDEWKSKAELLKIQLGKATEMQKSSSENVASVIKQQEERNAVTQSKEYEVAALRSKVDFLELEVDRHKTELDKSSQQFHLAQQEATEMGKTIQDLKSELQIMEEAKVHALENENAVVSNIQVLTEERNKLKRELDIAKCELEKVKKEMEGLDSKLQGVSLEARETKVRFLTKQFEADNARAEIDDLRMTAKKNEEGYGTMLENARCEIVCLQHLVERLKMEFDKLRFEWDSKALDFASFTERSEEETIAIKSDMEEVTHSVREAELRVSAAEEDELQMLNKLKRLDTEASAANNVTEQAKAENLQLKEMLLDKENEIQSISQENYDLISQEAAAMEKIKELSSLLREATNNKCEENADKRILLDEKMKRNAQEQQQPCMRDKRWKNGSTMNNDLSTEKDKDTELTYDELDSKIDGGSTLDSMEHGAFSPTKQQQQQQKKKKALMQKFGSLLRKK
ncbi:WEB family protein [Canna indica]|uniref:WEB family protein n=1 Tax=Canna indica TaxID=4628 RepID=A0AAQ3KKD0_9LILI|nr:WEB family protein [Canna indica]